MLYTIYGILYSIYKYIYIYMHIDILCYIPIYMCIHIYICIYTCIFFAMYYETFQGQESQAMRRPGIPHLRAQVSVYKGALYDLKNSTCLGLK